MNSFHSNWCLVWGLEIVWIHWKKIYWFFFFPPWPRVLSHICTGPYSAKDLRVPHCRSPEFCLCPALSLLVFCLQITAISASRNPGLGLSSARPPGSVHPLLPAVQFGTCLQAASWDHLLLLSGIIILCFLLSNAWNCFFFVFFFSNSLIVCGWELNSHHS